VGAYPVPFIAQYAARKGLRYSPEADERWLRVWEPYATLKTPIRYEHVLESTGDVGSLTLARFVVTTPWVGPQGPTESEIGAWIAIVQDSRVDGRAAATSDPARVFAEPLDLVPIPRRATGDAAFDAVFASFAKSDEDLTRAFNSSVRKLTLSWKIPLHLEVRPGGFILAPVALAADENSLSWFVRAISIFGEKAAKRSQPT
jgi:hypothetical protein